MQSKWHHISIKRESFNDLKEIQKAIPIKGKHTSNNRMVDPGRR